MRRLTAAFLLAFAALLFLRGGDAAHADDLLFISSDVHYNVRADQGDVFVLWDVSVTNDDPATTNTGSTVSFYEGLTLPVFPGATELTAQSAAGAPLSAVVEETDTDFVNRANVAFDQRLFFGETYDFRLSYVVPETRDVSLLVTPYYTYLPLLALGDEATVTLSLPDDPAWSSSLEATDCESGETTALVCGGSENVYVAGLLEVSQPDAVDSIEFEVAMDDSPVSVELTYFLGEDGLAAHQRGIIEAALPLLADAYGIPMDDSGHRLTVRHGGRQTVFGYEGVTTCATACEIVISPAASDQTLIHELAHLWSGIYEERWLAEGFAEWTKEQVEERLPAGLLGPAPAPFMATVSLQLYEWRDPQSLIGADEEYLETTATGYALSLRFIEELADEVGAEGLREVNREIRAANDIVDSEDYMDFLEDVTGINPDSLFRVWVFPASWDERLSQRREARTRYADTLALLQADGLPEDALDSVWTAIGVWQFSQALSELDTVEADVDRYLALLDELSGLEFDADTFGLAVPGDIEAAILRWDFTAADELLGLARTALGAYGLALERVAEPLNLWERFGLLGDDPDEQLERARQAFESGAFDRSLNRSESAVEMVDGASGDAMRRLLVVAGILSAVAGAIGVAYWIALLRQRRLAGP